MKETGKSLTIGLVEEYAHIATVFWVVSRSRVIIAGHCTTRCSRSIYFFSYGVERYIYSDESGFPSSALLAVSILVGTPERCASLRTDVMTCLQQYRLKEIKRSKIRAKKKSFVAAQELFKQVEYYRTHGDIAVLSTIGPDIKELYRQLLEEIKHIFPRDRFVFFPDKNLTLHWHRSRHMFSEESSFTSITPVTTVTEPLIMICDLYAGMTREFATRTELGSSPLASITYTPDKYKRLLYETRKEIQEQ